MRLQPKAELSSLSHILSSFRTTHTIWKFETIIDKHEEQELATVKEEGKQPSVLTTITTCDMYFIHVFQVS